MKESHGIVSVALSLEGVNRAGEKSCAGMPSSDGIG